MTTILDVLFDQIVFLATASDAEIHPDVVVAQLEAVVAAIERLSVTESAIFNTRLASRLAVASGPELEALRDLQDSLDV